MEEHPKICCLLCANMVREIKTPLVIENSANSRCLKHVDVNNFLVIWQNNKEGCMTRSKMADLLNNLNGKLKNEN